MQQVLEITAPFFALIFLGTILRSINFLDHEKTSFLSRFAFYILMPTMLFSNIAKTSPTNSFNFNFLVSYEAVTIFLIIIAALLGTFFNKDLSRSTMIGLNISYPNYGYIGIPMCLMAFGAEAAIPLAFILLADTIVLLTFSSFFLALSNQKKSVSNISTICYNLVKSIVSQPLLISVCLGMVVSQFEIKITETVSVLIDTLAGGAAPVALIALGASITFKYPSHHELELIVISIGKLILHPCLIILVFFLWPTEVPVWAQTAILCASLPVAANVFVLAGYHGVFKQESANSIVLTTILSTFTVPIILYFILNVSN
tara:strand:- start:193 stop:1140 length:948 start_codon:yes stop_codon:yes gene_type:complete